MQLLASIFSEGYGMHDDHFLIIEAASSWSDGYDYHDWLPWNQDLSPPVAQGHSFTYTGFIFLVFEGLQFLNIEDPKLQMLIIRLIQSAFWIIAIINAFKISAKIGNLEVAKRVSWLLLIGALMPFLSVRNLAEMTCVPFLLLGIWNILKNNKNWSFILAGIYLGIAFSIRFQMAVFIAVFGITVLVKYKFKKALLTFIGIAISIGITQGMVDFFVWGKPFIEFMAYVEYNISDHKYDYVKDIGTSGWYKYILILGNISIPVIGFFYWFGLIRYWKKLAILVLPLIAFTIFHSYYPNRQERFIFPMIPIFLIAGITGWEWFKSKSDFWTLRPNLWKKFSKPFFIISIFVGIVSMFISAKLSRIDSMYFLYEKEDITYVLKEHPSGDTPLNPYHYAGQWKISSSTSNINQIKKKLKIDPDFKPNYIYAYGNEDFKQRFVEIKNLFPKASIIETFEPSWYDKLLHWINPNGNNNEVIRVIEL